MIYVQLDYIKTNVVSFFSKITEIVILVLVLLSMFNEGNVHLSHYAIHLYIEFNYNLVAYYYILNVLEFFFNNVKHTVSN